MYKTHLILNRNTIYTRNSLKSKTENIHTNKISPIWCRSSSQNHPVLNLVTLTGPSKHLKEDSLETSEHLTLFLVEMLACQIVPRWNPQTCSPKSEAYWAFRPRPNRYQKEHSIQQIQPGNVNSDGVGGSFSLSYSSLNQKLPLKCYNYSYSSKSPYPKDIGRKNIKMVIVVLCDEMRNYLLYTFLYLPNILQWAYLTLKSE